MKQAWAGHQQLGISQSTAALQNQQWEAQAAQARQRAWDQLQQQSANGRLQQEINSQQQDIDLLRLSQGIHSRKQTSVSELEQNVAAYQTLQSISANAQTETSQSRYAERRNQIAGQKEALLKQLNSKVASPESIEEAAEILVAIISAINSQKGREQYPSESARKDLFEGVFGFYADYLAAHPEIPTK